MSIRHHAHKSSPLVLVFAIYVLTLPTVLSLCYLGLYQCYAPLDMSWQTEFGWLHYSLFFIHAFIINSLVIWYDLVIGMLVLEHSRQYDGPDWQRYLILAVTGVLAFLKISASLAFTLIFGYLLAM